MRLYEVQLGAHRHCLSEQMHTDPASGGGGDLAAKEQPDVTTIAG